MLRNKKEKLKKVGIAAGLVVAGIGVGYFIGKYRNEANNQYIWRGILNDAVSNGSTDIFWDLADGPKSLKFAVNFIEEIIP